MDRSITLYPEENVAFLTAEGEADFDMMMSGAGDLFSHPDWRPGMNILVDDRNLRVDNLTAAQIQRIAETLHQGAHMLPKTRVVVVMGSKLDFGLARMWQSFTEMGVDSKFLVSLSMEEAVAWLGLPPGRFC